MKLQETFTELSNALHDVEIAEGPALERVKLALHHHHVALHEVLSARRGFHAELSSLDGKDILTAEGDTAEEALHELHVSLSDHCSAASRPAGTPEKES